MSKTLPFRLARAFVVAVSTACFATFSPAQLPPDTIALRLRGGVDWLNAALSTASRSTRSLQAQILPMDVANYKHFVGLAYGEEVDPTLGDPALAAFFQSGARVDAQVQDVCFLLYNPKAKSDLTDQFVEPHSRLFGESIVPYAFLAAHEVGHCLDFQRSTSTSGYAAPRSKLRLEVAADAFAILLLRRAGVPSDQLVEIVKSRRSATGSHATWRWIGPAFDAPLPSPSPRLIEELWNIADTMSEKAI